MAETPAGASSWAELVSMKDWPLTAFCTVVATSGGDWFQGAVGACLAVELELVELPRPSFCW